MLKKLNMFKDLYIWVSLLALSMFFLNFYCDIVNFSEIVVNASCENAVIKFPSKTILLSKISKENESFIYSIRDFHTNELCYEIKDSKNIDLTNLKTSKNFNLQNCAILSATQGKNPIEALASFGGSVVAGGGTMIDAEGGLAPAFVMAAEGASIAEIMGFIGGVVGFGLGMGALFGIAL